VDQIEANMQRFRRCQYPQARRLAEDVMDLSSPRPARSTSRTTITGENASRASNGELVPASFGRPGVVDPAAVAGEANAVVPGLADAGALPEAGQQGLEQRRRDSHGRAPGQHAHAGGRTGHRTGAPRVDGA